MYAAVAIICFSPANTFSISRLSWVFIENYTCIHTLYMYASISWGRLRHFNRRPASIASATGVCDLGIPRFSISIWTFVWSAETCVRQTAIDNDGRISAAIGRYVRARTDVLTRRKTTSRPKTTFPFSPTFSYRQKILKLFPVFAQEQCNPFSRVFIFKTFGNINFKSYFWVN